MNIGEPSFAELGYPEFNANIWFELMLRAGTPAAVLEPILSAAKAAHADPEVKAKLEWQGFDMSGQSGSDFAVDIKAQAARWERLVKTSGFKAGSSQSAVRKQCKRRRPGRGADPTTNDVGSATSGQLISDGECFQDQVRDRIGM